jgi:hypothetical protein
MLSAPFHQQVQDQLNHRWEFDTVATYLRTVPSYQIVNNGDILNVTTKVMKLTWGKLIHQEDWNDWLQSEYLQLDQYHTQGMFGLPVAPKEGDAIFHLVWTYNIKAVDGRKKARCVCNGSTRSGQVRVLAETYAIASNKPVLDCSTLLLPLKTSSFSEPMSPMPLLKPPLPNNRSSSDRTKPSMNGG